MCLICRDGRASRRPAHLEDRSRAGAQSPVPDGQQVTEGKCLPFLPQKEFFQASTFPEWIQGVQVCSLPRWRPLRRLQSTSEVAQLWSLSLFTCPFCPPGMPMLSVQTCGIVCMLVSLITLWKHSSVYPLLQRLCACMKTHSLTHTPPVFQAVALLLTLTMLGVWGEAEVFATERFSAVTKRTVPTTWVFSNKHVCLCVSSPSFLF